MIKGEKMPNLNERLRDYRKESKITQEQIAKVLGINRCAVVEMESGRRKVSAEELIKLSEFYKITIDELVYGEKTEASLEAFTSKL